MRSWVFTVLTTAFENPYAPYEKEYDAKLFNEVLTTVGSIVSVGLGALISILSVLAIVTTTLDVVYLTVPPLQGKIDRLVDERRRGDKISSRFGIISKAAIDAYDVGTTRGENIIMLYLKKRIAYYIILAIVIYFAVVGWDQIIGFAARMIVDILDNLGLIE